ncbi:hypothetical protein V2W45_1345621 [Cenococcum geophilum]
MAENFQLSPEDWLCVLTLSTKYPQRVLFKACCEAYTPKSDPPFHPSTLQRSLNSSGLGELSRSALDYLTASNSSQKQSIYGQDYALEATQHPSSPPQYKPPQDYEAFGQNSIASPAVSQISHLDINSSTIAQSTLRQSTNTQRLGARFFCTFCAESGKSEKNRYGTKADWKRHLTNFHETGEEFPCSICAEVFKRYYDLRRHFRQSHSDQPTPPATDIRVHKKLAYGCGFLKCKAVLSAWEEWCKHVAGHIEHGRTVSQWCYSTVFRNLLRQEGICGDAKAFLTQACNKWNKDRSELEWRPEDSITRILRQQLECCDFGPDRDTFLELSFRTGFNMPSGLPARPGIPSLDSISKHDTLNVYELDGISTDSLSNSYSTSQFENAPPEYQLASSSIEQPQLGSTITDAAQRQTPNHELSLNAIPHHTPTSTSLDPAIHLGFKFSSQFQHHHHQQQQQQQSNTEPRNNKETSASKRIMDGIKRCRVLKMSQRYQTAASRNAQIVNSPRQWPTAEVNGSPHQPSGDQNPNFLFADPPPLSGLPGSTPVSSSAQNYCDSTRIPQYFATQSGAPIATDEVMQGAHNFLPQHNAFQARQQVPPGVRSASDRSRRRPTKAAAPSRNLGGGGTVHN